MISKLRESKEVDENPIDWSKRQLFICDDEELVILSDGGSNKSCFYGTVLFVVEDSAFKMFDYSKAWNKKVFKPIPIHQEIILKNN